MEEIETPKRGRGRPRKEGGPTPKHNLRIPDELWDEAVAAARGEGEPVTELIIRAMEHELARLQGEWVPLVPPRVHPGFLDEFYVAVKIGRAHV